jgi:hypothetical protein
MYPNTFLRTLWRSEFRNEVFVAMSFDPGYRPRYERVIEPAIRRVAVDGVKLTARRVDVSQTGDSLLTQIVDGIAHSQMVLADVSTVGRDAKTGYSYRNANVLYEVGVALACRQPAEVLLIRDDNGRFLFDVSTVPHLTINFTDESAAVDLLSAKIVERLRERQYVNDARVQKALASISPEEANRLRILADLPPDRGWGRVNTGVIDFESMAAIPRLLDKQLIEVRGVFESGQPVYVPTHIGRAVAQLVKAGLPTFKADRDTPGAAGQATGEPGDASAGTPTGEGHPRT